MSFKNAKSSVDKDQYEWCLRQSKGLKAIDPQRNIQMRNHKLLPQIPRELENAVKFGCNQNCTLDDISNTLQDIRKRTNIGRYYPYKSSSFKDKLPFRMEFKGKPKERVEEVTKKKILGTTVIQQNTIQTTVQRKRKTSMPLKQSQRRNPPWSILNQNLWEMQSEKNLIRSKTQGGTSSGIPRGNTTTNPGHTVGSRHVTK
ncbi:hypothetical protein O181_011400 [Austropuccinia psidii MF-1]|uniref:Uncharacterized protein n=1 Tax=Austropuccinia psidii MF-1 TaxID=1389203 RepID=A0A9Q3GLV7_9BASI|nr:hypothetical protein [Austropuccinia psidii MF-1]